MVYATKFTNFVLEEHGVDSKQITEIKPHKKITFDKNIRSRKDDLRLEHGDKGDLLFDDDSIIMETKTLGSYPLWFVKELSELKIYSQSFSKYGSIYTKNLLMEVSDYV